MRRRLGLNSQNLIIGAEADLALSQTFKALEPAQEPQFEDSDKRSLFHP